MQRTCHVLITCMVTITLACSGAALPEITGELMQWHTVTLTFDGPESSETGTPNPFTDYRLDVTFTGPGGTFVAPGYFAADGDAAETGAVSGTKWRVHFTPNAVGDWKWTASFRAGPGVATADDAHAGKPAAFDGASGVLSITAGDARSPDFRAGGTLQYTGGHYLHFAGTDKAFLKGGADSPENFLAYADFDGTVDSQEGGSRVDAGEAVAQGFLHRYEPHVRDWQPGDPTWQNGKGKGIIGAVNYLASKGMNSVYFLTMNVNGDGDDTWPWIDRMEFTRFDCSKLDQWNIVFTHMQRRGVMLHVITQETENDQLLDGGDLGPARKLYYRELISRFGHHNAIVWMLGEENTNTTAQLKDFSRYIKAIDPYDHPITVHTTPKPERKEAIYGPLLGYQYLDGPSLQNAPDRSHATVIEWLDRSATAGRPWVVFQDEQNPANTGVKPDADDPDHEVIRDKFLWGTLLAGGGGVEWYFGYKYADNDLKCEDWRSRDRMWDQTRIALDFMHTHLPFETMRHADELTPADDYVLAKPGDIYAVYLPKGGTTTLDLGEVRVPFSVHWFNPRSGGGLLTGSVAEIRGPGKQRIGNPPADAGKDWVALIRKK